MRIHIIGTRGFPSSYGGFETLVRHLAPYLVGRGHELTVFDRGTEPGPARVRMVDGVRVLRSRGLDGTSSSTLSHGLYSVAVAARERPDAALVMNVANGFFLPALRARKVPIVLNVDGIEWERAKWSPTGRRVFRAGAQATARWADELISDSKAIADHWRREFHRDSTFIPYGGDSDEAVPTTGRVTGLGLVPGQYALVVARMVPENNVEQMVAGALRSGAPTVVVGSGSSDIEHRVRALGTPPQLHTLGHVSDQQLLASLWAHCGVYLHGHSVGGTNPALVQAMGLGAPVLAFGTVFNAEVLAREDMLVTLDPAAIEGRVRALLGSAELRAEASAWGRRRVAEVYNWKAVCAGYESVITGAARGRVDRLAPADTSS